MQEQDIINEVLRYINDDTYNYAVLIDGDWGCGKTYFIKKDVTEKIKSSESRKKDIREVKYISLYGCRGISDIQENIAWSLIDKASAFVKNKDKKIKKLTKNVFSTSRVIGNIAIRKICDKKDLYKLTTEWLDLSKYIFIFDDLERVECDINEIFGYLNQLVEHENVKIIFVANEDEIICRTKHIDLEKQYSVALSDKISWPKEFKSDNGGCKISKSGLDERRKYLFKDQNENLFYSRMREKLIGVTIKYEPNFNCIASNIISNSISDDKIKELLNNKIHLFLEIMTKQDHINLRTFQFFLSKVNYVIKEISKMDIEKDHLDIINDKMIDEVFDQSMKCKIRYKQSEVFDEIPNIGRNFKSIRDYIYTAELNIDNLEKDILKIKTEIESTISKDDPFYTIPQEWTVHTQRWCEGELEKLISNLNKNMYPISLYQKIFVFIQKLIDIGFNERYKDDVKEAIKRNIKEMKTYERVDDDLWYIDDVAVKKTVESDINEINNLIDEHFSNTNTKTIKDILLQDNWVELLSKYVDDNSRFIDALPIFSKVKAQDWLNNIKKAEPDKLQEFRDWLYRKYSRNRINKVNMEDAKVLREIYDGLEFECKDLVKKHILIYLKTDLEELINLKELNTN